MPALDSSEHRWFGASQDLERTSGRTFLVVPFTGSQAVSIGPSVILQEPVEITLRPRAFPTAQLSPPRLPPRLAHSCVKTVLQAEDWSCPTGFCFTPLSWGRAPGQGCEQGGGRMLVQMSRGSWDPCCAGVADATGGFLWEPRPVLSHTVLRQMSPCAVTQKVNLARCRGQARERVLPLLTCYCPRGYLPSAGQPAAAVPATRERITVSPKAEGWM